MTDRGKAAAAGRPAYIPRYHGAEADSRYPSARSTRNAIANLLDVVVVFGVFACGYLTALLTQRELMLSRDQTPIWLTAAAVLITLYLTNTVLLPSRTGSSFGQLVTGLVWIRGADGTRPSARELLRAFFKHHGAFRFGGVGQFAPDLVVVRRRDLGAHRAAVGAGYTEH